jgi:hypothetical protein
LTLLRYSKKEVRAKKQEKQELSGVFDTKKLRKEEK